MSKGVLRYLRLAPLAPISKPDQRKITARKPTSAGGMLPASCPLLKVQDPNAKSTRFWEKAFIDVNECKVRGLDIQRLPSHVKPFAEFMRRQAKKKMTRRDVIKAYVLTVSSVQRQAITPEALRRSWPDHPFTSRTRPEDTMGILLRTPVGQAYLNQAEQGVVDPAAVKQLQEKFAAFGLDKTFGKQLSAAVRVGKDADSINASRKNDSPDQWTQFVKDDVPFVGPAKAGFFSALLGRGDLPTADAKQIEFWLCRTGEWNRKTMSCKAPSKELTDPPPSKIVEEIRDQLQKRLDEMNVSMPKKFRPHYQHLVHHAIWDQIGRTKTTHQEMIDAMESA
jgi:hypothetical protein